MLVSREMVRREQITCTECEESVDVAIEWHGTVEIGANQKELGGLMLCRECAQHLMRILLEDIIAYDNGVHVSLRNIMYHGQKGQYNLLNEERDLEFRRFRAKAPV